MPAGEDGGPRAAEHGLSEVEWKSRECMAIPRAVRRMPRKHLAGMSSYVGV